MDVNVRRLVTVIKNYRSIALGSFIFMAALTFFISGIPPFSAGSVLLYAVFFAGLFIIYLSFRGYRISALRKMERLLFELCDPEAFLEVYGEFVGMLGEADINTDVFAYDLKLGFEMYWFTLCEGYTASGDYSGALEFLNEIAEHTPQKQEKQYSVLCRYQLCLVNLALGDTDQAERQLDHLVKAIALLSPKDNLKYVKYLQTAQYSVNIALGVYDYAEKAFADLYDTSENEYERVNSKFALAKVYLHSGDTTRAREALEYVVAHGNKLHIVEEAKERLALLEQGIGASEN
jgi:FimV-like protein